MRMRIIIMALLWLILPIAKSQTPQFDKSKGKLIGRLYANFHVGLTEPVKEDKAFAVERAYLGYAYTLSDNFYAKVLLDIGSPNDASDYSKLRRYAYFRNAYLRYKHKKWTVDFGLVPYYLFKLSEKYWGHRYIDKSYLDKYSFGSTADLGFTIIFKATDWVIFDASMTNGEGYKSLQTDEYFKYSVASTFTIEDWNIQIRPWYDYLRTEDTAEQTTCLFAGWKYKNKLKVGAEYNYQFNVSNNKGHDQYGWSVSASYQFKERWQVFGRYDKLSSNTPNSYDRPWNLADDGSRIYAGIQFTPFTKINLALNYQDWVPYASNTTPERFIYFNVEVNF